MAMPDILEPVSGWYIVFQNMVSWCLDVDGVQYMPEKQLRCHLFDIDGLCERSLVCSVTDLVYKAESCGSFFSERTTM